jgi:myosin heavy subunit
MSDSNFPNNENENKSNRGLLAAILGIALLGTTALNVYLLYNKSQQTQTIAQQTEKIAVSDSLNRELTRQVEEATKELDAQKTSNADLNAAIDKQKAELAAKGREISAMIKKGGNDRSAIAAAEAKMQEMQATISGYMAEIDRLNGDIGILKTNVTTLTEAKTSLEKVVADKDGAIKAGDEERAKMQEEATELKRKVELGAILKVNNLKVTPMWTKRGKDDWVTKAGNCEKIKVEFNVIENKVTKPGANSFTCKITNPRGETLFMESAGSGTMKDAAGADMRFTMFKAFDYQNDAMPIVMEWRDKKFEKGEYQVEVFNGNQSVGKMPMLLK